MKRKVTIKADFAGVLPVGPFSNMRPGFSAQEEFEIECDSDSEAELIESNGHDRLMALCYNGFQGMAEKARIEKVKSDLKDFRFHREPNTGEEYPSVSSICSYDKTFFNVTDEDLVIYAAQGNIIDAEIRNYVKTGIWTESKDLLGCTADRFILKNRATSRGKTLALSGWNFIGFLEKYPIADLQSVEKVAFCKKYKHAGTPDLLGTYNGLKTLVSIKRTENEVDNFTQEAGYSLCDGYEDVVQFMVVEMKAELDGGNKQGYSKPAVTTDVAKYQELFLRKRNEVKKIYGV